MSAFLHSKSQKNVNISSLQQYRIVPNIYQFVGDYSNAAAIITTHPALPAYMPFSDEAAPIKFDGIVEVACAVLLTPEASVVLEPVPTAVGPAAVVLLYAGYVEVTDATTCETVIVRVIVAVEVRVVVEELDDCATATRGRKSSAESVGSCIVDELWCVPRS
jgi:hypothetical protein